MGAWTLALRGCHARQHAARQHAARQQMLPASMLLAG